MLQKGNNAMKSVKIERTKLLEVLKENRDQHEKDYIEALAGFNEDILEVAESNIKIAKKISNALKSGKTEKDLYSMNLNFEQLPSRPQTYREHYDRAIRMVELSADEVIELEASVFNQLVMDEWSWKGSFVASTQKYLG